MKTNIDNIISSSIADANFLRNKKEKLEFAGIGKYDTKMSSMRKMNYQNSVNSSNSAAMELVETPHITRTEFFHSPIAHSLEKTQSSRRIMSYRVLKFKLFRLGFRVIGRILKEN